MKEACGVFGVYAPGRKVANLTFDGLFALQHRGQESAGMAVSDGNTVTVVRDMGLVATVFDERTLSGLQGHLAIGRTRYSTHGASDWDGAQPVYRPVGRAGFALGHNGNLTNTTELAEKVGMFPGSIVSDSDVVAELLAHAFPETEELSAALQAVLPIVEGAFSFVLMNTQKLFGVRDPYGFRPLCLGRLGPADAPEGWVLASESPALSVIGATFVREIAPGELVVIDEDGPRSLIVPWLKEVQARGCASSSSPTSHAPTASSTGARCTPPAAAWESCWRRRRRPKPIWSWGCPVWCAGGGGLRPGQRHPLRAGTGEEPLHRAQLHRSRPAGPGRCGAAQAQPTS